MKAYQWFRRRLLVDLTPLLDVTMILLFGVMVNSVELIEKSTQASKADADDARGALAERQDELAKVDEELRVTRSQLQQARAQRDSAQRFRESENAALVSAFGKLLGLRPEARRVLEDKLKNVAEVNDVDLQQLLNDVRGPEDASQVFRALRRLQEMQKVFTFIDLDLDAQDFLAITADGRPIDRISARKRDLEAIERDLRRAIETVRFSEVVLILFRYDGRSRDRSVEASETVINRVLETFRASPSQAGRQFRYGRVGLVRE